MIERDIKQEEQTYPKEAQVEERIFEIGLRPQSLQEFIGQDDLKENLSIMIEAAKKREEPIEHVLLYGNPGLGKTTLAHIIANELESNIRITSGPALERVGDLAAILSNLNEGDVLFIDEIHRMNKTIEEVLYPAMEDYALDIVVGKGPTARTLRLGLDKFTIIGATTRLSLLSSPLRDRFGATFNLRFYSDNNIEQILHRSAKILEVETHQDAMKKLSTRARKTPRIANRLLKRARDGAQVRGNGSVTDEIVKQTMNMLAIDELGLSRADRHILETIIDSYKGGPIGIETLAAATQHEIATIMEVHEPFLLQTGMLIRSPRGRIATEKAYTHLNRTQEK